MAVCAYRLLWIRMDCGSKVTGVRSIYDGLRQDSLKTPQVAELIDAILLDKTRDDAHFRLWYLRLWQAVVDAKRILGQPKFEDDAHTIAGNLTAIQLKEYRDRIAHWWTGNVDFEPPRVCERAH